MKNQLHENRQLRWIVVVILLLVGVLVLLRFYPESQHNNQLPNPTNTQVGDQFQTPIYPTTTSTPTMEPTLTPTITPTTNWNDFSWLPAPTIGVTQIPPIVEAPSGEDDVFLYKDVIVTITFDLSIGWGAEGKGYFNLDNLEDNGKTNSDVFILAEEGTGLFYSLWPANNARDYWPPTGADYDSCTTHLSEFGGYTFFDPNLSYCFLTDEGRIGIVQEVADSFQEKNGIATKSYRITVYKQKVDR